MICKFPAFYFSLIPFVLTSFCSSGGLFAQEPSTFVPLDEDRFTIYFSEAMTSMDTDGRDVAVASKNVDIRSNLSGWDAAAGIAMNTGRSLIMSPPKPTVFSAVSFLAGFSYQIFSWTSKRRDSDNVGQAWALTYDGVNDPVQIGTFHLFDQALGETQRNFWANSPKSAGDNLLSALGIPPAWARFGRRPTSSDYRFGSDIAISNGRLVSGAPGYGYHMEGFANSGGPYITGGVFPVSWNPDDAYTMGKPIERLWVPWTSNYWRALGYQVDIAGDRMVALSGNHAEERLYRSIPSGGENTGAEILTFVRTDWGWAGPGGWRNSQLMVNDEGDYEPPFAAFFSPAVDMKIIGDNVLLMTRRRLWLVPDVFSRDKRTLPEYRGEHNTLRVDQWDFDVDSAASVVISDGPSPFYAFSLPNANSGAGEIRIVEGNGQDPTTIPEIISFAGQPGEQLGLGLAAWQDIVVASYQHHTHPGFVVWQRIDGTWQQIQRRVYTGSDSNGIYGRFLGLDAGRLAVLSTGNFQYFKKSRLDGFILPATATVTWELRPAAPASGVYPPLTLEFLRGSSVVATETIQNPDTQTTLELADLPRGQIRVQTVAGSPYRLAQGVTLNTLGSHTTRNLVIEGSADINGTISLATPPPFADIPGQPLLQLYRGEELIATTRAGGNQDSGYSFAFRGLLPDTYRVELSHADIRSPAQTLTVIRGANSVHFDALAGADITVTVTDVTGEPLPLKAGTPENPVRIVVYHHNNFGFERTYLTSKPHTQDGEVFTFKFAGLYQPENLRFELTGGPYSRASNVVTQRNWKPDPEMAERDAYNLRLRIAPVHGTLTFSDGTPYVGPVRLRVGFRNSTVMTTTNAEGKFDEMIDMRIVYDIIGFSDAPGWATVIYPIRLDLGSEAVTQTNSFDETFLATASATIDEGIGDGVFGDIPVQVERTHVVTMNLFASAYGSEGFNFLSTVDLLPEGGDAQATEFVNGNQMVLTGDYRLSEFSEITGPEDLSIVRDSAAAVTLDYTATNVAKFRAQTLPGYSVDGVDVLPPQTPLSNVEATVSYAGNAVALIGETVPNLSVQTDNQGVATLTGLLPGDYYLEQFSHPTEPLQLLRRSSVRDDDNFDRFLNSGTARFGAQDLYRFEERGAFVQRFDFYDTSDLLDTPIAIHIGRGDLTSLSELDAVSPPVEGNRFYHLPGKGLPPEMPRGRYSVTARDPSGTSWPFRFRWTGAGTPAPSVLDGQEVALNEISTFDLAADDEVGLGIHPVKRSVNLSMALTQDSSVTVIAPFPDWQERTLYYTNPPTFEGRFQQSPFSFGDSGLHFTLTPRLRSTPIGSSLDMPVLQGQFDRFGRASIELPLSWDDQVVYDVSLTQDEDLYTPLASRIQQAALTGDTTLDLAGNADSFAIGLDGLTTAVSVEGTRVENGLPIEGLEVTFTRTDPFVSGENADLVFVNRDTRWQELAREFSFVADDQGRVDVDLPNGTYRVSYARHAFVMTRNSDTITLSDTPVSLEVTGASASVGGRFVGYLGEGVPGIEVIMEGGGTYRAVTDAEGRFIMNDIPDRDQYSLFYNSDTVPAGMVFPSAGTLVNVRSTSEVGVPSFVATPYGVKIQLREVDRQGNDFPYTGPATATLLQNGEVVHRLESDTSFFTFNTRPGSYDLQIEAPGLVPGISQTVTATLNSSLSALPTISILAQRFELVSIAVNISEFGGAGRVGEGIPVRLNWGDADGELIAQGVINDVGEFSWDGLTRDLWLTKGEQMTATIVVPAALNPPEAAVGQTELSQTITDVAESDRFNFTLSEPVGIRGRLETFRREPIEGTVTLRGPGGPLTLQTQDGVWEVDQYLAGEVTIDIVADGYAPKTESFTHGTGGLTDQRTTLSPARTLEGQVQRNGHPLEDVQVTLNHTAVTTQATTSAGEFLFSGLWPTVPGSLSLYKAGYRFPDGDRIPLDFSSSNRDLGMISAEGLLTFTGRPQLPSGVLGPSVLSIQITTDTPALAGFFTDPELDPDEELVLERLAPGDTFTFKVDEEGWWMPEPVGVTMGNRNQTLDFQIYPESVLFPTLETYARFRSGVALENTDPLELSGDNTGYTFGFWIRSDLPTDHPEAAWLLKLETAGTPAGMVYENGRFVLHGHGAELGGQPNELLVEAAAMPPVSQWTHLAVSLDFEDPAAQAVVLEPGDTRRVAMASFYVMGRKAGEGLVAWQDGDVQLTLGESFSGGLDNVLIQAQATPAVTAPALLQAEGFHSGLNNLRFATGFQNRVLQNTLLHVVEDGLPVSLAASGSGLEILYPQVNGFEGYPGAGSILSLEVAAASQGWGTVNFNLGAMNGVETANLISSYEIEIEMMAATNNGSITLTGSNAYHSTTAILPIVLLPAFTVDLQGGPLYGGMDSAELVFTFAENVATESYDLTLDSEPSIGGLTGGVRVEPGTPDLRVPLAFDNSLELQRYRIEIETLGESVETAFDVFPNQGQLDLQVVSDQGQPLEGVTFRLTGLSEPLPPPPNQPIVAVDRQLVTGPDGSLFGNQQFDPGSYTISQIEKDGWSFSGAPAFDIEVGQVSELVIIGQPNSSFELVLNVAANVRSEFIGTEFTLNGETYQAELIADGQVGLRIDGLRSGTYILRNVDSHRLFTQNTWDVEIDLENRLEITASQPFSDIEIGTGGNTIGYREMGTVTAHEAREITFTEALDAVGRLGAQLGTDHRLNRFAALRGAALEAGLGNLWVGLVRTSDTETAREDWRWVDDEPLPVDSSDWAEGFPLAPSEGGRSFAYLGTDGFLRNDEAAIAGYLSEKPGRGRLIAGAPLNGNMEASLQFNPPGLLSIDLDGPASQGDTEIGFSYSTDPLQPGGDVQVVAQLGPSAPGNLFYAETFTVVQPELYRFRFEDSTGADIARILVEAELSYPGGEREVLVLDTRGFPNISLYEALPEGLMLIRPLTPGYRFAGADGSGFLDINLADYTAPFQRLVVEGSLTVSGTVTQTDPDGGTRPVSGVTVTAQNASVVTGVNGSYRLTDLLPGSISIQASAPGYDFTGQTAAIELDGNVQNIDFNALGAATITGVARDASGDPILNALVRLLGQGNVVSTTMTDVNGVYTFEGVLPSNSADRFGGYRVVVSAEGFFAGEGASQEVGIDPGTPSVTVSEITLSPNELRGVVRLSDGSPLQGATLQLTGENIPGFQARFGRDFRAYSRTVYSDASGSYVFVGIPKGVYRISVSMADTLFVPAVQTVYFDGGILDLEETEGLSGVGGQVTLGDDDLGGITLRVEGEGLDFTVESAADGRYLAAVAPGTYTVTPETNGFTFTPTSQTRTFTAGSLDDIDFQASETTRLFGRVTWQGDPLPGTTLTAYSSLASLPIQSFNPIGSAQTFSQTPATLPLTPVASLEAAPGHFVGGIVEAVLRLPMNYGVFGPEPRVYRVEIVTPSGTVDLGQVNRFGGSLIDFIQTVRAADLGLPYIEEGPWSVILRDVNGNLPVEVGTARLTVTRAFDLSSARSVETADDGSYLLSVTSGSLEVVAGKEAFTIDPLITGVAPVFSEVLEVNFEAVREHYLSGTVTDEEGLPFDGATVSVGALTVATETDGSYRIGPFDRGLYPVTLDHPFGQFAALDDIGIDQSDLTNVDLEGVRLYAYSISIETNLGAPASGTFQLLPLNETIAVPTDGVELRLPAGEYVLNADPEMGLWPNTTTFTLGDTPPAPQMFTSNLLRTRPLEAALRLDGSGYVQLPSVDRQENDAASAQINDFAISAYVRLDAGQTGRRIILDAVNDGSAHPQPNGTALPQGVSIWFDADSGRLNAEVAGTLITGPMVETGRWLYLELSTVSTHHESAGGSVDPLPFGVADGVFTLRVNHQTASTSGSWRWPLHLQDIRLGQALDGSDAFAGAVDRVVYSDASTYEWQWSPARGDAYTGSPYEHYFVLTPESLDNRSFENRGRNGQDAVWVSSADSFPKFVGVTGLTAPVLEARAGVPFFLHGEAVDGGSFGFEILDSPSRGRLVAVDAAKGHFEYQYIGAGPGTDAFSYRLTRSGSVGPEREVQVVLVRDQALPELQWGNPQPIVFGTSLGEDELNAVSNVLGSFSYSAPEGTVLDAGTYTLTATFTPENEEGYRSREITRTLQVLPADPGLQWTPPASLPEGTVFDAALQTATANVPGVFAYQPAAGTRLTIRENPVQVTFTPDSTNYHSVTLSRTINGVPDRRNLRRWAGSFGLSEDESVLLNNDLTGNGAVELLSFASGADPSAPVVALEPVQRTSSGRATFEYRVLRGVEGLRAIPHWSTNFGEWRSSGFTQRKVREEGDVDIVEVSIPVPEGGMIFTRIEYVYDSPNSAPESTVSGSNEPVAALLGETLEYTASSTDEDGDRIDLMWELRDSEGALLDTGGDESFEVTFSTAGTYTITLTSTDQLGASSEPVVRTVTVSGNQAPVVRLRQTTPQSFEVGSGALSVFPPNDPEGDTISTVSWFINDATTPSAVLGTGASFSLAGLAVGTYTVHARVSDAQGGIGTDSVAVTITPAAAVAEITSPNGAQTFSWAEPVTLTVSVQNATITGQITWTDDWYGQVGTGNNLASTVPENTTWNISVQVQTDRGVLTDTISLTIEDPFGGPGGPGGPGDPFEGEGGFDTP